MGTKADHYREEPARCRKLAKSIQQAHARDRMLDVARQYGRFADQAEAKE